MLNLEIYGEPIPWKRPGRNTKTNIAYDTQKKEKDMVRWQIKSQYHGEPIGGPVFIHIVFGMPVPKGESKKRREQMLVDGIHHIKRPDNDNLQKFYFDCLTGPVLMDDSQIVDVRAQKRYTITPFVSIRIVVLNRNYLSEQDETSN